MREFLDRTAARARLLGGPTEKDEMSERTDEPQERQERAERLGRKRAFRQAATIAAGLALLAVVLLAAGCGGLGVHEHPSAPQQRQYMAHAMKFSQCMRSHGIKAFPNPTASGFIGTGGNDPNAPRFLAAQGACNHYLPAHPAGS
jgi:hypothetical protein